MKGEIYITALSDFPLISKGDDLADLIAASLAANDILPEQGDIIVVAQKVVSKSEGRTVDLRSVSPRPEAVTLAEEVGKDPRVVELILTESRSIIRKKPGVLIVEHNRGWIMANAGIDASNVFSDSGQENVLLLPFDPDASAHHLRAALVARYAVAVGVVISDSFGRPWRLGTSGVAIGAAGLPSLWDRRGETDLFRRELVVTQQAVADEVATAAALVQGQGSEGRPVALIRGLDFRSHPGAVNRPAADLIRDPAEDMFR